MVFKLSGGSNLAGPSNGGVRVHLKDQAGDAIYVTGTTVPTDGWAGYAKGCLFVDTDVVAGTSGLYENKGSNTSATFALISATGGSGVAGSLDNAYSLGRAITVDEGAVVWTDATTGALNAMSFVKTGAGTGDVVDISMDAANVGSALNLDMNLAVGSYGIYIDNGAGARTQADIYVKSDSTGAHNVIGIAQSGAGAGVGFNFVGSYNGNGGGQALSITLDANDNLTTEIMQVTTGAGNRNLMFDFNLDHTDSGTVSHVFDIDMGGVFDSNVIDVAYAAASTGNTIFVNLDNAVAATALHIEGSGVRTQPMVEVITDSTSSASLIDISVDGAITGQAAVDIDMNLGLAANAIYIDAGAGVRTANLLEFKDDGSGNVDAIAIVAANTGSGSVMDIDVTGIRTGNIIDIAMSGAATGSAVIKVDLDAAVACAALNLDAGNAIRTADIIDVTFDGSGNVSFLDLNSTNTGSGNLIDIAVTGVHTGHALAIGYPSAASTGNAIDIAMGTNVAGAALYMTCTGARTDSLVEIIDSSTSNAATINAALSAASTAQFLDVVCSGTKVAGDIIDIDMGTNLAGSAILLTTAGVRSAPLINIVGAGTDGGTNDHTILITQSAQQDSTMVQLTCDTVDTVGDVFGISMGTNLTGRAIAILPTGARTGNVIDITDDSTSNTEMIDINVSGINTGNILDITFSTAASTGNAIDINMGNGSSNVAGMAISVSSAATGTSDEGSCFDVSHTGALAAGADVMRLHSTGNISSTSNILSIVQDTGAGTSGAYGLHISCTGTNVEAIKVDDGKVVFDETLTVTGLATLTAGIDGALVLAGTETIAAGGTTTALDLTKTLHNIDADAGGDIFTLGNGVAGQIVICILKTATGIATITPTTFTGGTSVTLNAAGDSVMFAFQTTLGWSIIGGNSYAVV